MPLHPLSVGLLQVVELGLTLWSPHQQPKAICLILQPRMLHRLGKFHRVVTWWPHSATNFSNAWWIHKLLPHCPMLPTCHRPVR